MTFCFHSDAYLGFKDDESESKSTEYPGKTGMACWLLASFQLPILFCAPASVFSLTSKQIKVKDQIDLIEKVQNMIKVTAIVLSCKEHMKQCNSKTQFLWQNL